MEHRCQKIEHADSGCEKVTVNINVLYLHIVIIVKNICQYKMVQKDLLLISQFPSKDERVHPRRTTALRRRGNTRARIRKEIRLLLF